MSEREKQAQAAESQSRAKKYNTEAEIAPKETVLKYMDTNKDGMIDADVRRKMDLARVLLDEDKWQAEKEERQQRLQMEHDESRHHCGEPSGNSRTFGSSRDGGGGIGAAGGRALKPWTYALSSASTARAECTDTVCATSRRAARSPFASPMSMKLGRP